MKLIARDGSRKYYEGEPGEFIKMYDDKVMYQNGQKRRVFPRFKEIGDKKLAAGLAKHKLDFMTFDKERNRYTVKGYGDFYWVFDRWYSGNTRVFEIDFTAVKTRGY